MGLSNREKWDGLGFSRLTRVGWVDPGRGWVGVGG